MTFKVGGREVREPNAAGPRCTDGEDFGFYPERDKESPAKRCDLISSKL